MHPAPRKTTDIKVTLMLVHKQSITIRVTCIREERIETTSTTYVKVIAELIYKGLKRRHFEKDFQTSLLILIVG
jgi:hypothetical protein